MNTKRNIELNTALEEAHRLGFTKQLIRVNGMIKKLLSTKAFFKHEFAIVKTYPYIFLKYRKGTISYVVLNDGTLGYFLKENKRQLRTRLISQ